MYGVIIEAVSVLHINQADPEVEVNKNQQKPLKCSEGRRREEEESILGLSKARNSISNRFLFLHPKNSSKNKPEEVNKSIHKLRRSR
jgi:hypothetical protein